VRGNASVWLIPEQKSTIYQRYSTTCPTVLPSQDSETGQAFSFGPFRLVKAQMQLVENGVPVRLGSRALELLLVLVERSGEVLSRQELEARVWPRTVIEETSLRVQIAAMRKALRDGTEGARYITNIPGRGYCFVAHVERDGAASSLSRPLQSPRTALTTTLT
jgi:DNA-binding winged helix-turn-helix (wHTH) protein